MKEKKWIMSRVFVVLLCVSILFALAACGTSQGGNNGDDVPENSSIGNTDVAENDLVDEVSNVDFDYSKPDGTKVTIIDAVQGQRYLIADMYIDFANSEYLNGAVLNATVPATCKSTKLLDVGSGGGQLKVKGAQEGAMPESKLCGISDNAALEDFINGKRKITKGGFFENKNECIISEDLAKHASLSIGDTMTFENITLGGNGKPIVYELEIVGIYSDKTEKYTSPYPIPYFNRRNEIITGFDTIMDAENAESGTGVMMEVDYYLKDINTISDFEKELRTKGMPSDFSVIKS